MYNPGMTARDRYSGQSADINSIRANDDGEKLHAAGFDVPGQHRGRGHRTAAVIR